MKIERIKNNNFKGDTKARQHTSKDQVIIIPTKLYNELIKNKSNDEYFKFLQNTLPEGIKNNKKTFEVEIGYFKDIEIDENLSFEENLNNYLTQFKILFLDRVTAVDYQITSYSDRVLYYDVMTDTFNYDYLTKHILKPTGLSINILDYFMKIIVDILSRKGHYYYYCHVEYTHSENSSIELTKLNKFLDYLINNNINPELNLEELSSLITQLNKIKNVNNKREIIFLKYIKLTDNTNSKILLFEKIYTFKKIFISISKDKNLTKEFIDIIKADNNLVSEFKKVFLSKDSCFAINNINFYISTFGIEILSCFNSIKAIKNNIKELIINKKYSQDCLPLETLEIFDTEEIKSLNISNNDIQNAIKKYKERYNKTDESIKEILEKSKINNVLNELVELEIEEQVFFNLNCTPTIYYLFIKQLSEERFKCLLNDIANKTRLQIFYIIKNVDPRLTNLIKNDEVYNKRFKEIILKTLEIISNARKPTIKKYIEILNEENILDDIDIKSVNTKVKTVMLEIKLKK